MQRHAPEPDREPATRGRGAVLAAKACRAVDAKAELECTAKHDAAMRDTEFFKQEVKALGQTAALAMLEFKREYACFSKDEAGSIDVEQLGAVMRHLGEAPTDAELRDMIDEVGVDHNGTMGLIDFMALMAKRAGETGL